MAAVPFVDKDGWHIVGRAYVEKPDLPVYRSCIFIADGNNPFEFVMRNEPILEPEPESASELACEDPTLIKGPEGYAILFSQVRRMSQRAARELGSSKRKLPVIVSLGFKYPFDKKSAQIRTVLEPLDSLWWARGLIMCKEAEVVLRPGLEHDYIVYEFFDGERSQVAAAKFDYLIRNLALVSIWDSRLWLGARPGKWDSEHVSTGPIIDYGKKKLMFYNGRDSGNTWAIGEIVFDPKDMSVISRADKPLIVPPQEIGWGNQYIAFSSGVWASSEGDVFLYHHIADKRIRCAVGRLET